MFLYLKLTIFLATEVTPGPSASAHCGDVIPAGNLTPNKPLLLLHPFS